MKREYYSDTISNFLRASTEEIVGKLASLLTRARQGMVIVVPPGDPEDPTRKPAFYDPTFDYLRRIGFDEI